MQEMQDTPQSLVQEDPHTSKQRRSTWATTTEPVLQSQGASAPEAHVPYSSKVAPQPEQPRRCNQKKAQRKRKPSAVKNLKKKLTAPQTPQRRPTSKKMENPIEKESLEYTLHEWNPNRQKTCKLPALLVIKEIQFNIMLILQN